AIGKSMQPGEYRGDRQTCPHPHFITCVSLSVYAGKNAITCVRGSRHGPLSEVGRGPGSFHSETRSVTGVTGEWAGVRSLAPRLKRIIARAVLAWGRGQFLGFCFCPWGRDGMAGTGGIGRAEKRVYNAAR